MVLRGDNMIITNMIAKNNLSEYSNKNNKISRDIRDGNLYKIITGLYETDPNTPGYLLASSIYGPSYISFEFALSFYGLIPERVTTITCATFDKKKKKEYNTYFGVFTYRDIPSSVYPEEILLKEENNYSYQIATPEKALCDKLYTLSPLLNYSNLENMLFNDLRIDEELFKKLDVDKIGKLSELYHSTNVKLLAKYMRRNVNE
jgi:predicted transcriptional regulator of viral defense system